MRTKSYLGFHFERCAGASLKNSLEKRFRVYSFQNGQTWHHIEELKRIGAFPEVLLGPQPYGLHFLFHRDWKLFTVLRDPCARFISHCESIQEDPAHSLYESFVGKTPEQIGREKPQMCNWFVRKLSGRHIGEVREKDMRKAWHLLQTFDRVYILENSMYKILCDLVFFMHCSPLKVSKINVRDREYTPSEEVKEMNKWDCSLYRQADVKYSLKRAYRNLRPID